MVLELIIFRHKLSTSNLVHFQDELESAEVCQKVEKALSELIHDVVDQQKVL